MPESRLPATGAHRRGWLTPPPGVSNEALVALARAADALCRAALATAERLERTIPGALDDELHGAALAYLAAAAAMDAELQGKTPCPTP